MRIFRFVKDFIADLNVFKQFPAIAQYRKRFLVLSAFALIAEVARFTILLPFATAALFLLAVASVSKILINLLSVVGFFITHVVGVDWVLVTCEQHRHELFEEIKRTVKKK